MRTLPNDDSYNNLIAVLYDVKILDGETKHNETWIDNLGLERQASGRAAQQVAWYLALGLQGCCKAVQSVNAC